MTRRSEKFISKIASSSDDFIQRAELITNEYKRKGLTDEKSSLLLYESLVNEYDRKGLYSLLVYRKDYKQPISTISVYTKADLGLPIEEYGDGRVFEKCLSKLDELGIQLQDNYGEIGKFVNSEKNIEIVSFIFENVLHLLKEMPAEYYFIASNKAHSRFYRLLGFRPIYVDDETSTDKLKNIELVVSFSDLGTVVEKYEKTMRRYKIVNKNFQFKKKR